MAVESPVSKDVRDRVLRVLVISLLLDLVNLLLLSFFDAENY